MDNHFDRSFGRFTPFADIDIGNTLNQRTFCRPFLTLGKVATFEAGNEMRLLGPVSLNASLYYVAQDG